MQELSHPKNKLSYAVSCITSSAEAPQPNKLEYIMNTRLNTYTYSGNWVIEFSKEAVLLNGTKLNTTVQEMLLTVDRLMHRLVLTIAPNGSIVKVKNYEAIKQLWTSELRLVVAHTYTGAYAEALLEHVDTLMAAPSNFTTLLESDVFLYYYLCAFKKNDIGMIPALGQAPVEVQVQCNGTDSKPSLVFQPTDHGREQLDNEYAAQYGEGTLEVNAKCNYQFDDKTMLSMEAIAETTYGGRQIAGLNMNAKLL